MNGLLWVAMTGVAGWLAGKLIGEKGYGRILRGSYAQGVDMVFGAVGASFAGHLFSWTLTGPVGLFTGYVTALLGAIALVGITRQASERFLLPNPH